MCVVKMDNTSFGPNWPYFWSQSPIKVKFSKLWHSENVEHFLVWLFIDTKEPNSGNYRHIFYIGTIVPIISAVGLFCIDIVSENNQTRECFRMSKLTKPYFRLLLSRWYMTTRGEYFQYPHFKMRILFHCF